VLPLNSSRTYLYSLHIRYWNFLGLGRSVRFQNLKKCVKLTGISRGLSGGCNKKNLFHGKVYIFSETAHLHIVNNIFLLLPFLVPQMLPLLIFKI